MLPYSLGCICACMHSTSVLQAYAVHCAPQVTMTCCSMRSSPDITSKSHLLQWLQHAACKQSASSAQLLCRLNTTHPLVLHTQG